MLKNSTKTILVIFLFGLIGLFASAQKATPTKDQHPEWSKPFPSFRIAGNLYYVGTYDLACYLITTSQGNILINTGLANSADMISANIKSLGFKPTDTKVLLTTQAHFDHMGAMAAIKTLTGAKMMVDAGDAAVLADGGGSDYSLVHKQRMFDPVKADRLLHNGDVIKLGDMQLTMLHHPGHTKGSCSFMFTVKDDKRAYKVLIANLPSIITDKNFSAIPTYPNIAKDYEYTFKALKGLSFDIWVASHASQFGLHTKHTPGDRYNPTAFLGRKDYDKALNELEAEFTKKLKVDAISKKR